MDPWVWKIPWRRAWQPIPVFSPGKSHGQRNLAGRSLQGCRVRHSTRDLEHTQVSLRQVLDRIVFQIDSNPMGLKFIINPADNSSAQPMSEEKHLNTVVSDQDPLGQTEFRNFTRKLVTDQLMGFKQ